MLYIVIENSSTILLENGTTLDGYPTRTLTGSRSDTDYLSLNLI